MHVNPPSLIFIPPSQSLSFSTFHTHQPTTLKKKKTEPSYLFLFMMKTLPFAGATSSLNFPATISDVLHTLSEASAGVLSPALPLLRRLELLLLRLQQTQTPAPQPLLQALTSLRSELHQSFSLVKKPSLSPLRSIQNSVQNIGRCLGPLSLAWADAGDELREEMGFLQKEMMSARLGGEIVEDVEDLVMRVKRGEGEVLRGALEGIGVLIGGGLVGEGEREGVVEALVSRLGSAKNGCRLSKKSRAKESIAE